ARPAKAARPETDANRRDHVVPPDVLQVDDVVVESRRAALESNILEDGDLGVAEDPERRDLVVHVVPDRAQILVAGDAEVVTAKVGILVEADPIPRNRTVSPALRERWRDRDDRRKTGEQSELPHVLQTARSSRCGQYPSFDLVLAPAHNFVGLTPRQRICEGWLLKGAG